MVGALGAASQADVRVSQDRSVQDDEKAKDKGVPDPLDLTCTGWKNKVRSDTTILCSGSAP